MAIVYLPQGRADLASFLYSLEQEADCSEPVSLASGTSDTSNGMNIASKSSRPESGMDGLTTLPSLETSASSYQADTPNSTGDTWMSLLEAFRVSPLALLESAKEATTSATCGPTPSRPFAWYDRQSASWRTSEDSFLQDISDKLSVTWPKAGMTVNGASYRQVKWERRISETDYGSWPTPTVMDTVERKGMRPAPRRCAPLRRRRKRPRGPPVPLRPRALALPHGPARRRPQRPPPPLPPHLRHRIPSQQRRHLHPPGDPGPQHPRYGQKVLGHRPGRPRYQTQKRQSRQELAPVIVSRET